MKNVSSLLIIFASAAILAVNGHAQLRWGVTAGPNFSRIITDPLYEATGATKTGADIGALAQCDISGNWKLETRIMASLIRTGAGEGSFPPDGGWCGTREPLSATDKRELSFRLPIMPGYFLPLSRRTSIYVMAGPEVAYSPKSQIRTKNWSYPNGTPRKWSDWRSAGHHKCMLDANVNVGVELWSHNRFELSYDVNLTSPGMFNTRRRHTFAIHYGYLF